MPQTKTTSLHCLVDRPKAKVSVEVRIQPWRLAHRLLLQLVTTVDSSSNLTKDIIKGHETKGMGMGLESCPSISLTSTCIVVEWVRPDLEANFGDLHICPCLRAKAKINSGVT